jgi:hypothetical protein
MLIYSLSNKSVYGSKLVNYNIPNGRFYILKKKLHFVVLNHFLGGNYVIW